MQAEKGKFQVGERAHLPSSVSPGAGFSLQQATAGGRGEGTTNWITGQENFIIELSVCCVTSSDQKDFLLAKNELKSPSTGLSFYLEGGGKLVPQWI